MAESWAKNSVKPYPTIIRSRPQGSTPYTCLLYTSIDKYKGSFLLKFAVLCFAVFILVSLVGQQFQIMEKRQELEDLQQQLSTQNARNEEDVYKRQGLSFRQIWKGQEAFAYPGKPPAFLHTL